LQKVANSILYFKLRRHGQKIRTQQQKNQSLSKNVEKKERKNSLAKKKIFGHHPNLLQSNSKPNLKKNFFNQSPKNHLLLKKFSMYVLLQPMFSCWGT